MNDLILSNGTVRCDRCATVPADEEKMRQVQHGLRIRFYCLVCWFKHRVRILQGNL